jgi:hypothetical protein
MGGVIETAAAMAAIAVKSFLIGRRSSSFKGSNIDL